MRSSPPIEHIHEKRRLNSFLILFILSFNNWKDLKTHLSLIFIVDLKWITYRDRDFLYLFIYLKVTVINPLNGLMDFFVHIMFIDWRSFFFAHRLILIPNYY